MQGGSTTTAHESGGCSIRRAERRDVRLVAEVLEMAGRGHLERGPWNLIYPDRIELMRALEYFAGGDTRSWCHHSLFHIAELDGAASAALVTFEASDVGGDTSLAAPLYETFSLLGWTPERIAEVGPLAAPYVECFPDMPAGTWIIENVGTIESARRHGLVRALLEHALELGRERGWTRAQISCLIGNDRAQRAYERAGFEVVEERRSEAFEQLIGAPGFSRMTRNL